MIARREGLPPGPDFPRSNLAGGARLLCRNPSAIAVLVVSLTAAGLAGGCDHGDAVAANLDCDMMLRRVKDGVLEIQRRHKQSRGATAVKAASLLARIEGYSENLRSCSGASSETVGGIAASLVEMAGTLPRKALDEKVQALAKLAETLPVEATPAAEYDD